jgi:hypothetical protein
MPLQRVAADIVQRSRAGDGTLGQHIEALRDPVNETDILLDQQDADAVAGEPG